MIFLLFEITHKNIKGNKSLFIIKKNNFDLETIYIIFYNFIIIKNIYSTIYYISYELKDIHQLINNILKI